MSITHTLKLSVTGTKTVLTSVDYSGDGALSQNLTIADSVTDQEVAITIDVSQIQSFFMNSTKALTVETNNASTPTDTIVLVADTPYIWRTGDYHTLLLTADVTKLFLTNASGSTATFTLECVYDSTL